LRDAGSDVVPSRIRLSPNIHQQTLDCNRVPLEPTCGIYWRSGGVELLHRSGVHAVYCRDYFLCSLAECLPECNEPISLRCTEAGSTLYPGFKSNCGVDAKQHDLQRHERISNASEHYIEGLQFSYWSRWRSVPEFQWRRI